MFYVWCSENLAAADAGAVVLGRARFVIKKTSNPLTRQNMYCRLDTIFLTSSCCYLLSPLQCRYNFRDVGR